MHSDFLGEVNLHEVDVSNVALYWVTLHFFHDCVVALAVNGQGQDGVCTCRTRQCYAKVATSDGQSNGLHAVAIKDARNAIFGAQTTGSCASGFATDFG